MNGETRQLPPPNQLLYTGPDGQLSPDGVHYAGSYAENGSGVTSDFRWNLIGEK